MVDKDYNPTNVLDQFFKEDKIILNSGRVKVSVLLSAKRDLGFLRGIFKTKLSLEQTRSLSEELPNFAAILVYCSSIELLARTIKRKDQNSAKSKATILFSWSARRLFGLTISQSNALWNLRNAVSHQYTIHPKYKSFPYGTPGVCKYSYKTKGWEFNLNAMYSNLTKTIKNTRLLIDSFPTTRRDKTLSFIEKHGFVYTFK